MHLPTSSTSAPASRRRFHQGRGWIAAGRTAGFGTEGNADVFRILVEDGTVVRTTNLTKSERWDSAPGWGTHEPAG